MRAEVLFDLPPFIHNSFGEMDQPENKLLLTKSKGKGEMETAGIRHNTCRALGRREPPVIISHDYVSDTLLDT